MAQKSTNTNQKALKAGVGYTVGNILIKGIAFVSLPIFSRLMSVADFGTYSTFVSYVSVLTIIIGLALHVSVKNALYDFSGRLKEYCSSVSLMTLLNTALLLVVGVIFSKQLGKALSLEGFLIIFLVLESAATALISFYNHILSVDYKYKEYLSLSFVYAVSGIVISLILILFVYTDKTYYGRIIGATVATVGVALYILFQLYRKARPRFRKEYWSYALKISLPIIPHGLSQLVLAQFDRIMIRSIINSTAAGYYSLAHTVGTIYQVVANSLDTVWNTWFFDRMAGKQYAQIRTVANYYATLLSVGAIGLMLVVPEVLWVMGGAKYAVGVSCAIPIVLAMFFSAMYHFPAAIEYYYKKTYVIAIGTCSVAVLNIILNAIFIPQCGYVAAAYTTVACYVVYYFVHVICSTKIHGSVLYSMRWHLLCILVVSAFSVLASLLVSAWIVRYALVVLLLAAFGLAIYKKLPQIKALLKDKA